MMAGAETETVSSHLTEVLGGDAIVVAAGQLVDKSQHLVFGSDELGLGGAAGQDGNRQ